MSKSSSVTIRILGHEYQVGCPEHEREALLTSAEYLNRRMGAIQRRGKALGMERIAVMAALNMARELMDINTKRKRSSADKEINDRLQQLQLKIDAALEDDR
ncbi:MAG: cell division protein ZapA [Nevskiales bacterium]